MLKKERIITFAEAINEALVQSMKKDKNVLLIGLGVDDPGGVFGTTKDIHKKFKSKTFKSIISELTNFGDDLKIYYNENIYLETSSVESSMKLDFSILEKLTKSKPMIK